MNKCFKYLKNILVEFIITFIVLSTIAILTTNTLLYLYPVHPSEPVVNMKVLQKYETITSGRHSFTKFILVLEKPDKTIVDTVVEPSTFYRATVGLDIKLPDNFGPVSITHITVVGFLSFLGFIVLGLLTVLCWSILIMSFIYFFPITAEFLKDDHEFYNVHYWSF